MFLSVLSILSFWQFFTSCLLAQSTLSGLCSTISSYTVICCYSVASVASLMSSNFNFIGLLANV